MKDVLSKMNLTVNVVYEAKYSEKEGKILSQSPEEGEMVSEFTEVTLVINKYEEQTPSEDKPEKPNENNQGNGSQGDDNKPVEPEYQYITVNLSSKGARDSFNVRVELLGGMTGKKILYEANHKRSDGEIKVPVESNASGLIKVYIDNELDSEMAL